MSLRVRRHYKLLVLLALVSAATILVAGDQPIVAYTVRGSEQAAAQAAAEGGEAVLSFEAIVHGVESLISGAWGDRLDPSRVGMGETDSQPSTALTGGAGDASR